MNAQLLEIDARRIIAGSGSPAASLAAFAPYKSTFQPVMR
jgi:hypothetical protein